MPGCPKRQQSWGTVHHQALVSPVASDLMSSPLRKRIRSPDLRDALSAGLPGGEKGGLTGGKWDGRQTRAKFRPAVPALDPAPLCSRLLWAEPGWACSGRRDQSAGAAGARWRRRRSGEQCFPAHVPQQGPAADTVLSPSPTHRSSSQIPLCLCHQEKMCLLGGRQSSPSGWKTRCIDHVF